MITPVVPVPVLRLSSTLTLEANLGGLLFAVYGLLEAALGSSYFAYSYYF